MENDELIDTLLNALVDVYRSEAVSIMEAEGLSPDEIIAAMPRTMGYLAEVRDRWRPVVASEVAEGRTVEVIAAIRNYAIGEGL